VGEGLSNFQVEAESNSSLFEDIAIQEDNIVSAPNELEEASNERGIFQRSREDEGHLLEH
jgi:hypothetical protein